MLLMSRRLLLPLIALWLALSLVASGIEIGASRARNEIAFQTDARIMHRLLSQRAVQHEAILATLALLQPGGQSVAAQEEQRLPAVYPQILRVERWTSVIPRADKLSPTLTAAAAESQRQRHVVLADIDAMAGHYWVVLAAHPASYALEIDVHAMVPWEEWPLPRQGSPVRVALQLGTQEVVVSNGSADEGGWLGQRLSFNKTIAANSQPFNIAVSHQFDWRSLPWGRLVFWWLGCAALCSLLAWLQVQSQARRRAEELLRFGQIARLNTLGELAAGLAHELNQPLAAVSANTQAASRLLNDELPDIDTARHAMNQAVGQARRAAEVLSRLRRAIERPGLAERMEPVNLHAAVRNVLALLQAETHCLGLEPTLDGDVVLQVQADPVALEQIIHNLLTNALQAMAHTPKAARHLDLQIEARDGVARLSIADGGPGIAPEALPRLFEPFFSTKEGGLGLGLSLCETLATGMGGRVSATNIAAGGTEFSLTLPLAVRERV
jgi:signal transduction histidine kinase